MSVDVAEKIQISAVYIFVVHCVHTS